MKKFLSIVCCLVFALSATPAVQILSETVLPAGTELQIYKENGSTNKYWATFYVGKERQVASISSTELKRYYLCKELQVDFQIVVQQLKTKRRIVIRC